MKPFAILINGLLIYGPGGFSPLAPLASQLEAAGWEVCIDTHFATRCHHPKPTLIIGHSQGGATALRLAAERHPAMVITFDAVRMQACPSGVRCINFRTPAYPLVPRAENIPVTAEHITMVHLPDLKQRTLTYANTIAQRNSDRIETDPGTPRMERSRHNLETRLVPKSRNSYSRLPLRHSGEEALPREQHPLPSEGSVAERWPDDAFGELNLPLEDLCRLQSTPSREVCP